MKVRFFLFFAFVFIANPFLLNAQTDDEAAVEASVADTVFDDADYTSDGSYKMPDDELSKYGFKKGTPVFVVVNVQHSIPNDSLLAIRELRELQKNFEYLGADFLTVHKNAVLNFENRDNYEIRLDEYNSQYQSVIFWNGKSDSDVYLFESIIQSSEAYSPQLNVDKTSSYVDEFLRKKEELLKFKNETINQNSVAASQKYISNLFLGEVYYLKNDEHFFPADFKGVKKLTVKSNYTGFTNPVNEAEFDQNGNPTKLILQSDDSDRKKINIQFSYLNGALKKIISTYSDEDGENIHKREFYYQDATMYKSMDDNAFSKYFINENGFLLSHSYYFYEYKFLNIEDELTFKGKTLSYKDYGNLNNREYTLNSPTDFFPVKVNLRNEYFYEIKRITKNEFLIDSDDSKTRIFLNEKGKISKIIMENLELEGESKRRDLIFEYFYEYY